MPVTRQGIADSTHVISHWGMPGVMVEAADGTVGYGYTGTHAHLPLDRTIVDCIENTFAPLLVGQDALAAESLNEKMLRHPPALWVGRGGVVQMAISAIDIALWDLKAKLLKVPLWQLLGGDAATRLEAYNTDGGWLNWDERALVEDAKQIIHEDGFKGIKIKLGKESVRED